MARITVLMGIYNCDSTLVEALDSLYAQTFQDFKIVLCEDGSTDSTYEVAKSYAEVHDNIILIRNEHNMGLNYTLNRCLEYADTEYCARMDGDDISIPTRFEKQIEFLDEHSEFAIVSTPMIYFDEHGEFRRGVIRNQYPTKYDFIQGTPFCHAPSMVRTVAYKSVDGYTEDKRLLRVEDYHLWFKMYAAGYKGAILNEHLYKMRDDRAAIQRRTYRNRINEAYVKLIGYKMLGLAWYYKFYALRPLIVGLLPQWLYNFFHRK